MRTKQKLSFDVTFKCPDCNIELVERPRMKDDYKVIECRECDFVGGFKRPETVKF